MSEENGLDTIDTSTKRNPKSMGQGLSSTSTSSDGPKSCSTQWTQAIHYFRAPLQHMLKMTSGFAAENPKLTILSVITFSVGIFVLGLMTNFTLDTGDQLWTPKGSKPVQHYSWIDGESGYPKEGRSIFMVFHANGDSVVGQDQINHVFQAIDAVRGVEGYEKICAQSGLFFGTNQTTCDLRGVTEFWNNSLEVFRESVQSDEDTILAVSAPTYPSGKPVSERSYGHIKRDDDGLVTSIQVFIIDIVMPDLEQESEDFEKLVLDLLLDGLRYDWSREEGNSLRMEVQAYRSFDDEFTRAIMKDIPLLPIVFVLMTCFTCASFARRNSVQSRSLLGFGGAVSILLSIMTTYGLMFTCGVPFTSMTPLIPFIMFGIGLDDTFIIAGCYERTDKTKSPTQRILDAIEECALSITITSITSSLAFGLGCISAIPSIFWLCLYAFPNVMVIYIYQLTFFVACIALDERRILENRRDCCICLSASAKDNLDNQGSAGDQQNHEESEAPENTSDRIMRIYSKNLMRPGIKAIVLAGFIALAVASVFSVLQLTQDFNVKDMLPKGSYVIDFFNAFEDYTTSSGVFPGVYFRFVDQSDIMIQSQMEAYIHDLVEIDAVLNPPEFFWLRDFRRFINETIASESTLSWNEMLDLFLEDPVHANMHRDNIVRDKLGNIITSRCFIDMDNINWEEVKPQIKALEDQHKVTEAQAINQGRKDWAFFTYDAIYDIWEFYRVSARELAFTSIVGICAVTGISLILIPHWTASIVIFPFISILFVDLLGFMQWVGIQVNPVSYIALVLSIGLMVDFLMHFLIRFYESSGNREEKVIESLQTMGVSILLGGFSTFLGTLPLAFSSSEIFITIFYIFLGLVTLGCSHGLILLPVVLSLIGSEDQPLVSKPISFRPRKDEE